MKRRALLGTLATTAFAGCTGYVGDAADGGTTRGTTAATTTDDVPDHDPGVQYGAQVVGTDAVPLEDVAIDVTVARSFTTEHPATLEFAFTNEAAERREFTFGSLVPWDALRGRHAETDGALLLAPGDGVVPEEPGENCWRATDGVALPTVERSERVPAGETVRREFDILATHDSTDCLDLGTYRFEGGISDAPDWGFEVSLVAVVYHGTPDE